MSRIAVFRAGRAKMWAYRKDSSSRTCGSDFTQYASVSQSGCRKRKFSGALCSTAKSNRNGYKGSSMSRGARLAQEV